jgi:hypothetical protein
MKSFQDLIKTELRTLQFHLWNGGFSNGGKNNMAIRKPGCTSRFSFSLGEKAGIRACVHSTGTAFLQ